MTRLLRRLGILARLMVDWDLFKRAFDAAASDPALRARADAILRLDPALAGQFELLRALWSPVEADLKALRE